MFDLFGKRDWNQPEVSKTVFKAVVDIEESGASSEHVPPGMELERLET